MENISQQAWNIFQACIIDYHKQDSVNAEEQNPYPDNSLEYLLYHKNWIDNIQWHLEDIIRDEDIEPIYALEIKRRIDLLNQLRTDTVEMLDDYFLQTFQDTAVKEQARINTESPAWAIDRLSILSLKIYHMDIEARREKNGDKAGTVCQEKLHILEMQRHDLMNSIHELLQDIQNGDVKMRSYRQMKMYNDKDLNPILYSKK